jgi:tRNA-2-methylthio-N6-dimethylallyladenosine synthase
VPGIRRLRFTSPYPTDFTDSVIAAMAQVPAVCEHVHLPVQSGSNTVLRRMLRRYTREVYLDVVARLRAAIPSITFSTDIIVGFPGETEAQFEETLTLVAEAGFDDAYTFQYSPRDGTPAMRMLADAIPDDIAGERLARLVALVRSQVRARHVGRVGEKHEVLIERPAKRGGMLGRTRTNLLVLVDAPETARGEYHHVRLTGTTGSTFIGSLERAHLAVLA